MSLPNEIIPLGLLGTGAAGGYAIERSLRFNSADSAYLSRTPASVGNRKTWTWAGWVKLAAFADTSPHIFGTDNDDANRSALYFGSNNELGFYSRTGGVTDVSVITPALFRDYSAWYHIVLTVDTTQAVAADVTTIYVNGIEQALTVSAGVQNALTQINNNVLHSIGRRLRFSDRYLDGYLADIHFIDGQALDPTSFGEFDANGIWQPIEYTGTYPDNSFHLDFDDNSTNAALGTDTSGNENDWTVNNISAQTIDTSYTGSSSINQAIDGIFGNSVQTDNAYTVTFNTPIPYNTLTVVYGNMANGQLGNPASGAVLSVNGSTVTATGTYGVSPYTTTYTKQYTTSTPGTLTSLGISAAVSGSHQTGIFEVFVNGSLLVSAQGDSFVDVPTNGSETDTGVGGEVRGNYATFNQIASSFVTSNFTITNGNLDASGSNANQRPLPSTIFASTGKWYYEFVRTSGSNARFGVINQAGINDGLGNGSNGWAWLDDGRLYYQSSVTSYGTAISNGDVVMIALDLDAGKVWYGRNGTWFGSGNPATGANPSQTFTANQSMSPAVATGSACAFTANFGQRPFAYTAPSVFKALCTANLPAPTIEDGSTAMDVVTYEGLDPTTLYTSFSPDFVWIKNRDSTSNHALFDTIRGATKVLSSNTTDAESTDTDTLTSFNSDGFTVGADLKTGKGGTNYVAWAWDAGSSTVTNNDGSISSQVRANTSAGFSIVTWTGTGSAGSVGHGLGVAPSLWIQKSRSTSLTNWNIYHSVLGPNQYLQLTTAASGSSSGLWGPTSTAMSLPGSSGVNNPSVTYVAYCFAPVEGYSAFGSYTGVSAPNFIYTGFTPALVIMKRTDTAGEGWLMTTWETQGYNSFGPYLAAHSNVAEAVTANYMDIVSNGFVHRHNLGWNNATGGTYIYAAFAENPFALNARAR
jgi:hypothetical protein